MASTQVSSIDAVSLETPVRLYFSNLEGTNRLVLERLKKGARLPTKLEITDFKKGYYDTSVGVETTFTAIGYNDNGYSRGIPVIVVPNNIEDKTYSFDVVVNKNTLIISTSGEEVHYEIKAINNASPVMTGTSTGTIDISSLPRGAYILTLTNGGTQNIHSIKFVKS